MICAVLLLVRENLFKQCILWHLQAGTRSGCLYKHQHNTKFLPLSVLLSSDHSFVLVFTENRKEGNSVTSFPPPHERATPCFTLMLTSSLGDMHQISQEHGGNSSKHCLISTPTVVCLFHQMGPLACSLLCRTHAYTCHTFGTKGIVQLLLQSKHATDSKTQQSKAVSASTWFNVRNMNL